MASEKVRLFDTGRAVLSRVLGVRGMLLIVSRLPAVRCMFGVCSIQHGNYS